MFSAVDRMKAVGKTVATEAAPSSIFGSALGLAAAISHDDDYRIAMYPLLSSEQPDLALGLASCLAYLLEQGPNCHVYRCFARIDADDDSGEISSDDYQFSPDDWALEGLDDNIQISGALHQDADGYTLEASLDLTLIGGGAETLVYAAPTLADLCGRLPLISSDIGSRLRGEADAGMILEYAHVADEAGLRDLLELVFGWNLDLYLYLWGVEWQAQDIRDQFDEVARIAESSGGEFAYWCLGMMALQASQAGLEEIGDAIEPELESFFEAAAGSNSVAAAAAALSGLGQPDRALNLLDDVLNETASASAWNAAIDIWLDAGRGADAIETCQRGLECGLEQAELYERYADLLMVAEANDWQIQDVLLIDPDEIDESEHISREIIGALKRAWQLRSDNLTALQLALTFMIDVDDAELWEYFEALVEGDRDSSYLGEIIDRLADLPDLSRGFDILQAHVAASADNPYARVNLAQLAIVDENYELARAQLLQCRETTARIDDELELELQRLELTTVQPDFEARFAELKVMLNARRLPSESDVEALENAIAIAPRLVDLHLLLSRCYMSWSDAESALEVLREASQSAGAHPRISQSRAQLLWRGGQRNEAVAELNRSLSDFPNDVGLLAQMAGFLIDYGQFDDARQFIERAESIAPSHESVWQLRRLIADRLSR